MTLPDAAVSWGIRGNAARLHASAYVVDLVIPLDPICGNSIDESSRWAAAGTNFVSFHPAGDYTGPGEGLKRVAAARAEILRQPERFTLVETAADLELAQKESKLAIGLHLEGSRVFDRDVNLIGAFHALGIRFCHPIFNVLNSFGGGCGDSNDVGLSTWGRQAIAEMNRLGMLLDGSHAGHRATLEMIDTSTRPVIFSHNGVAAVHEHFRNIRDDQIVACAQSGGVMGITGNSNYLGSSPSNETLFRHIDYISELVGPEHVGLGLDYVADVESLERHVAAHPDEWPGRWKPFSFAQPEQLPALTELMLDHGYDHDAVRGILGENWLRLFREAWSQ